MKQAIIDIGSNSIRLTLYETNAQDFKILFREKIVEDGRLSAEGIECACAGLLSFRTILQTLDIDGARVFATASLRNITNTAQALAVIQAATGYQVEILSGEDEALLGYTGAMSSGAFLDVGGASSEIVTFDEGKPVDYQSFPVGSLSLYRRCVKKILPGEKSLARIRKTIKETIYLTGEQQARPLLVCVGGTSRAVLKLARVYYHCSEDCRSITAEQLDGLCAFLCSGDKAVIDLILKLEPERIHTIVPGILVLQHIAHLFQAQQLLVSRYGVREGYLCKRILRNDTDTPRTEN